MQSSLSLSELCGYYNWVVDDSSCDVRYDKDPLNPDDEEHNATGGLTLDTTLEPATLDSMNGTIDYNAASLDFEGLVPAQHFAGLTSWKLKTKDCGDWDLDTFDDQYEPITITVMDAKDDNGHPFIRVEWSQEYSCSFDVIGKRQKEGFISRRSRTGKILDLSEGEKQRVGLEEDSEEEKGEVTDD